MTPPAQRTTEDTWERVPDSPAIAERFEIVDIAVAEHITHPTRGRLLRRLKTPLSAAELAAQLSVPVTRLYHHIKQLEAAELIHVAATRKVGAATERRYQASARSFQIPDELMERTPPDQLGGVIGSVFDLAKLDLVEFIERGGLETAHVDEQLIISLAQLQLTPARRAELVSGLTALLQEFSDDATDGSEPFNVFVAASPPTAAPDHDRLGRG